MISLVGFILTMGVLVFIHEFGHYYIAKISGVKIEEFSIGFGKEIFAKVDSNGVRWKICAIPLGGFVKMYGMDYSNVENKTIDDFNRSSSFYYKPWYSRFFIIAAGPLANYLFAILVLGCFYSSYGKPEIQPIIGSVIEGSPAAKAGIILGDKVVEVDGRHINDFTDLQRIIMTNLGTEVSFTVERDGEHIKLFITPDIREETKIKKGFIGIISKQEVNYVPIGIFRGFLEAIIDVLDISSIILKTLGQILIGERAVSEISGPLSIANESGKSLNSGFLDFILFLAMLSINLGLINLLPIPMLDGGRLVIIITELVTKKQTSKLLQNILLKIGLVIITFLIVISVSNDIKNLLF